MAVDGKVLLPGRPAHQQAHLETYLNTRGARGFFMDLSADGGSVHSTTLILKTRGRKTGRDRLVPLLYVTWGREYAIVGSKGGAPTHPAWYLNLEARPQVGFQVSDKAYAGAWRLAAGEERRRLWDYLTACFPPYADYQARTAREIPVVLLKAERELEALLP